MKTSRFIFIYTLLLACLTVGIVLLALLAGQKLPYMGDLAYITDQSGVNKLYLMDVQRQTPFFIKRLFINDCCLTWSPDGQALTFVSDTSESGSDLFSTDFHGPIKRLTRSAGFDLYPTYSPDGQQIAYTGYGYGNPALYVMNADGSEPRVLTGGKVITSLNPQPVWSHDGQSILFSDFDNLDSLLAVPHNCIDPCESAIQKIFPTNGLALMTTTFIPLDSSRLLLAAFERTKKGGYGIYGLDTRSSQPPIQIALNSDLASPTMALYDHWIAFVSGGTDLKNRSDEAHLFILDANCIGTQSNCANHLQKIPGTIHTEDNLSWSPDGRWLAYTTVVGRLTKLNILDTTCIWAHQDCTDYIHPLPITSSRYIRPVWRPRIQ